MPRTHARTHTHILCLHGGGVCAQGLAIVFCLSCGQMWCIVQVAIGLRFVNRNAIEARRRRTRKGKKKTKKKKKKTKKKNKKTKKKKKTKEKKEKTKKNKTKKKEKKKKKKKKEE